MTVNDLALLLQNEYSEKLGDTGYTTQLENWIIESIIQLSLITKLNIFYKSTPLNTVATNSTYELPVELRDIKDIRIIATDDKIDYENPKILSEYGFDLEQAGKPRYWWYQDAAVVSNDYIKKIVFTPIPNAIYSLSITYYYHPSGLVSGSVLPLSEEALLVVKSDVRMKHFQYNKDFASMNVERSNYRDRLSALITQERTPSGRRLIAVQTDRPARHRRPSRLRYPFE